MQVIQQRKAILSLRKILGKPSKHWPKNDASAPTTVKNYWGVNSNLDHMFVVAMEPLKILGGTPSVLAVFIEVEYLKDFNF